MVVKGPCTSVEDFTKCVSGICRDWNKDEDSEWLPWFRGEENANWGTALQPKLYRGGSTKLKDLLHLDQELRIEFRRRGAQLINGQRPADHWEWYFLMQHYGVTTRLLDWTDGALVGLYFAIRSRGRAGDRHGRARAAVYVLDPWWLNGRAFSRIRKRDRPEGVALSDWPQVKGYLVRARLTARH